MSFESVVFERLALWLWFRVDVEMGPCKEVFRTPRVLCKGSYPGLGVLRQRQNIAKNNY